MKEDFLHYVWKFQKFNIQNLVASDGTKISIIKVGEHNYNSGPDFFNAQVSIGGLLWAGNVEIHIKSSDWYLHKHEVDSSYDNVVLHVVWEHDADVYRENNSVIPTLELKTKIDENILNNYLKLFSKKQQWINCENDFSKVDNFVLENWLESMYFERLQKKSFLFESELKSSNNHWESLLFTLLCKNFGLKVNGESFLSIAQSVDFSVVKKCKDKYELEALLFGQAGFFEKDNQETFFNELKEKYSFLKSKFKLDNQFVIYPKYFRLRPPNFPTIRLSQLAILFSKNKSLFSEIIKVNKLEDYYDVFDISASDYWTMHYNFGITSSKRKKKLTKKFIDLLLINTIIPLKYSYAKYIGQDVSEEIVNLASSILSEENSIINKFKQLGFSVKNSLETQALLQLKNEYCSKNKCLQCAVGNTLIKSN